MLLIPCGARVEGGETLQAPAFPIFQNVGVLFWSYSLLILFCVRFAPCSCV